MKPIVGLFTPVKLMLVALLVSAVFSSGYAVSDWRNEAIISGMVADAAEAKSQSIADAQAIEHLGNIASDALMAEYALRRASDSEMKETVTQEVIAYVQAEAADLGPGQCLDDDWVRIHDLAATGSMPEATDPSGYPDGDASGITAGEALSAVTDNYGACNGIRLQLIALQEWASDVLAPYQVQQRS